jgi:hypothetical protein
MVWQKLLKLKAMNIILFRFLCEAIWSLKSGNILLQRICKKDSVNKV